MRAHHRRNERGSVSGHLLPVPRRTAVLDDEPGDVSPGRLTQPKERLVGETYDRADAKAVPALRLGEGQFLFVSELTVVISAAVLMGSPLLLPAYAAAALVWRARGLYARRFSLSILDDLAPFLQGALIGAVPAVLLGVGVLGSAMTAPLSAVAAMAVLAFVARVVAYAVILRRRRRGLINYPAVIVGAGPVAVSLARRLEDHPQHGLRPVGFLERGEEPESTPTPVLGATEDLAEVVRRRKVTDVVIGYGALPTSELVQIIRCCDRFDVEIHVLPRLFEMHRLAGSCDHVWGIPLVRLHRRAHRARTWRLKRFLDMVVSGAALLMLAPLLLATALAVRLEVGKGVLFEQVRVGLDGRPFTIRKFRSMRPLPPGVENPWSVNDDDRIGRVGRFIRRYSIDELPQLFNVFNGEMSLVGPRPERPEYVEQFQVDVPHYGDRHRVPVGLTGLAAVQGLRGDTSITDRAYFDNVYIENWSFALDLKILARTFTSVLKGTGA
jgi:exopolysaccharide biosynthesis polyprenyl glycosylphosphotransferase